MEAEESLLMPPKSKLEPLRGWASHAAVSERSILISFSDTMSRRYKHTEATTYSDHEGYINQNRGQPAKLAPNIRTKGLNTHPLHD